MIITNRKIAGITAQWAPYCGFSLLFDNPGNNFLPLSNNKNVKKLHCDCSLPGLKLYKSLSETLNTYNRELSGNYLFCPLPDYLYHVTALDGFSKRKVGKVFEKEKPALNDILNGLSKFSNVRSLFNKIIKDFSFQIRMKGHIAFRFHKLDIWNRKAFVVCLEPADKDSENILKIIENERITLLKKIKTRFGIRTASTDYTPHISLGYFVNKEFVTIDSSRLEELTRNFKKNTLNTFITFHSISLYGFTDMETFFKSK